MAWWLLRIEGVNFSATIDDTKDLSTIRGASLALLRLDRAAEEAFCRQHIKSEKIFAGASQCAYRFEMEGDEGTVRKTILPALEEVLSKAEPDGEPFQHIITVADIVPWTEGPAKDRTPPALEQATARNRTRQFRQWTVTGLPHADEAKDADPLDGVRPGTTSYYLPRGKIIPPNRNAADDEPSGRENILSKSVIDRRNYGRKARRAFYKDELGEMYPLSEHISFTEEFSGLIADPPEGLRPSLRSKIAVVYADGNGFSGIRDQVGVERFSAYIIERRRHFLAKALNWFNSEAKGKHWPRFAIEDEINKERVLGLRLETLLWGGDEFIFVMPAWLAFAFVGLFLAESKGWQIDGPPLTHAIGVAIAHIKTPIRQLRYVAKEVADQAKTAGFRECTTATFEIYESLAPPDGDLARARKRLYGIPLHSQDDPLDSQDDPARWLALPGDGFEMLLEGMAHLTGRKAGSEGAFPRSQIYAALRAVRAEGRSFIDADDIVARHWEDYSKRPGGKEQVDRLKQWRPPSPGKEVRPWALDLALITQFWDYAHPFPDPLTLPHQAEVAP